MDDFCRYADHPWPSCSVTSGCGPVSPPAHLACCSVRRRLLGGHAIWGGEVLVDTLSGKLDSPNVWIAFLLLVSLISADNLLWRLASWVANSTFVGVTGDLRRDLFRHLTGHSPSYFADRLPGMLSSRVTATSNAVFTVENMFMWNVLPPCAATVAAIAFVQTISTAMAAGLALVGGIMAALMFRLAAAGRPLHHEFANKAAVVDGEMVDVVSQHAAWCARSAAWAGSIAGSTRRSIAR